MENKNRLLPLIAAFKIFKSGMLFLLAFGLHHLRIGDPESILTRWIRDIRIDPDDKFAKIAIEKVTGMSTHRMHELGIFTFAYAALFATEGMGLAFRKRWAEYLTVVSTIGFLPLEFYEVFYTPNRKGVKITLMAINIAILVYLIWNLRRTAKRATRIEQ
jgi:uncharacterized membrane protein (DUF2068 family)